MINNIANNQLISGHIIRHSDIIKNKNDKNRIFELENKSRVINQSRILELCNYLVLGLRDRYSGNRQENKNKKLITFSNSQDIGHIRITIQGVLNYLKEINENFTEDDATTLIALCTHRHTSFSRVASYPDKLENILKNLKMNYIKTRLRALMNEIKTIYKDYSEIYVKLSGGHLFKADLSGANLSGFNLSGFNLRGADLSNTNFTNTNLSKADLRNAKLNNTNFTGANLTKANLECLNLSNINLTDANLYGANIKEVDLSNNSQLSGVIFTYNSFENVNLSGANLFGVYFSNVSLLDVLIRGTKFTGSIFDENIEIVLKFSNNLDIDFNHLNYINGSILTAIDSINNEYVDIKNDLMNQVFRYLSNKNTTSINNAVISILLNSTFDYTEVLINNFIVTNKFFDDTFKKANTQAIHFTIKELLFYLNYLNKLTKKSEQFSKFIINNNSFFNQLVYQSRIDYDLQDLGKKLYDHYIKNINLDLKSQIYNTYFDEEWFHQGLIFTTNFESNNSQTLYVRNQYMEKFLYKNYNEDNMNEEWDSLLYFANNILQPVDDLDFDSLFNVFKVFQINYQLEHKNSKFIKLINLLNLGSYKNVFMDALNKKSSDNKYIDPTSQNNLISIFNKFFVPVVGDDYNSPCSYVQENAKKNLQLKQNHVNFILNAYKFELKSFIEQAKLLLILSGIFLKYSASNFFGIEDDSPTALRYYAYGLMKFAYQLDASIFLGNNLFLDWENKFLGIGNIITCARLLSDSILAHCRNNFQDYSTNYAGIIPPAWL